MFDRLLAALLDFRRSSAAYIEPTPGPAPVAAVRPPESPAPAPVPAAPPVPPVAPAARSRPPLVYVRVLKDSRPVEVGSETVDLRADDVLSLPAEVARLLVEAKVVEPVETATTRPVT